VFGPGEWIFAALTTVTTIGNNVIVDMCRRAFNGTIGMNAGLLTGEITSQSTKPSKNDDKMAGHNRVPD